MEQLLNKPRTQRGLNTLNKILSAAAQVFYENGYSGTNISDIAKLAGVATGTFYIYFDSKYSLYKYLLLQCSHQIRKHLSICTKDCKSRREAERVGLRCWLEYIRENPYVYNIIWESLYVDRSLFEEYYRTFSRAYIRSISAAREKGEVRHIDDTVLTYVLMGATTFLGLKWGIFAEGEPDLDFVADEFMQILEHGIFEAPGPKPASRPPRTEKRFKFNIKMDEDFYADMTSSEAGNS